jgi:hypothetical protein
MRGRFVLAVLSIGCSSSDVTVVADASVDGDASVAVDADGSQLPDASPACGVVGLPCCGASQCSNDSTCQQGICACISPKIACGSGCSDLASDPKNCGKCGHDCAGGACNTGVCQPSTVSSGQSNVNRIIATSTHVYWSRFGSYVPPKQSGAVMSADLDGKNPVVLFDAGQGTSCYSLVTSTTDAYFQCGNWIYRCALSGCGQSPQQLLSLSGIGSVVDMALDTPNNRLYFTVATPYNVQTGGFVASISTNGGNYARLTANDQPSPSSLSIVNGWVYWLNAGTYMNSAPKNNTSVYKAPVGTNQTPQAVSDDGMGASFLGITVDGNTVFYGGSGGVRSVPSSGGLSKTFAMTGTGNPITAVLTDSQYVYWNDLSVVGGLYRCSKNCASPEPIVSGYVSTFALDDLSLWWADDSGDLRRLAKGL